jgi:hypothetical protein
MVDYHSSKTIAHGALSLRANCSTQLSLALAHSSIEEVETTLFEIYQLSLALVTSGIEGVETTSVEIYQLSSSSIEGVEMTSVEIFLTLHRSKILWSLLGARLPGT